MRSRLLRSLFLKLQLWLRLLILRLILNRKFKRKELLLVLINILLRLLLFHCQLERHGHSGLDDDRLGIAIDVGRHKLKIRISLHAMILRLLIVLSDLGVSAF